MYGRPPNSQDAYWQNYYGQVYNRSNYNPNPQNPYYPNGGYNYGNPNPNASSPQIYQNNNNYRNPQVMQPMKLDEAINKSSYSSTNRDIILETMLDNFSEKNENKVYLQNLPNNKIFIVIKNLNTKLVNKSYNIPIIVHIPVSYPNTPAEFYIHKKPRVAVNKIYYENQKIIDVNSFKINTDKICPFDPSKNNLGQIIEALKTKFSSSFPIYADKSSNIQQVVFGANNPDTLRMKEVIVESEKMTNKQVYELIKKQAKEAVLNKYKKFNTQYKLTQSYNELKTINTITRLKAGNSQNGNEHPMNESLNVLKRIKQRLYDIESGLNQEIQNSGNSNKTTLEKCDDKYE